jgi:hypothetical protein
LLWRVWGTGPKRVAFIMLNPSEANALVDDPTLRRCVGFGRDWGYDGLLVANLYSIKGADPDLIDFKAQGDLLSDRINEAVLDDVMSSADLVVAAWGQNAMGAVAEQLRGLARDAGCALHHLGLNKDGSPKHPLYLAKDTKPEKWT